MVHHALRQKEVSIKPPEAPASDNARRLFAGDCDFVLAASAPEHFPPTQGTGSFPEIALIGRSNVGKSSLINALTGRSKLARTSVTPGRTQQIIFFNLGNRLMLVDLPGYGHANAPRDVSNQWNALVRYYIQTRPNLKLMILLLDSRHGALAHDITMMDFLDKAAIGYQVIMTKRDQVRGTEAEDKLQHTAALLSRHAAARPELLLCSAEKKQGIAPIQELFASFALPAR